jgi:hypothetical protein
MSYKSQLATVVLLTQAGRWWGSFPTRCAAGVVAVVKPGMTLDGRWLSDIDVGCMNPEGQLATPCVLSNLAETLDVGRGIVRFSCMGMTWIVTFEIGKSVAIVLYAYI